MRKFALQYLSRHPFGPDQEDVPFDPLDMKCIVACEWSWSESQEFDQRVMEAKNLKYYPLDDAL